MGTNNDNARCGADTERPSGGGEGTGRVRRAERQTVILLESPVILENDADSAWAANRWILRELKRQDLRERSVRLVKVVEIAGAKRIVMRCERKTL